jgi:hypothetical protein
MDKIKSWIRWQWQHLQLRLIWYQLDKEGRLEWLREARYIYWRQQAIKSWQNITPAPQDQ